MLVATGAVVLKILVLPLLLIVWAIARGIAVETRKAESETKERFKSNNES